MLTHIRVKNFKSWADSGEVVLAPLTGFFGTNSSGKSSLLQMLLLLKQSIGSDDVLFFGDESSLVNLGSFRDVIHGHDTSALLTLECGCKPQGPVTIKVYGAKPDDEWAYLPVPIYHFTLDTSIQWNADSLRVEHFRYGLDSRDVKEIVWNKRRLSYQNLFGKQETKMHVDIQNCYGGPASGSADVLQPLISAFEHQFSHVYYLGPTRVMPQRCHHWAGAQPGDTGQQGQNAIDALLSARVDLLTTPSEKGDVPIEARISAWLREMALAHAFSLKRTGPRSEKNYEFRVQQSPTSPAVTLADMGYGLSQFLPVLVLCYYAPEGSTLILEQPGIHLHPKVQSQLADLLIEVVTERHLQVLVESHSEHLLNRLQRRIAEEEIAVDKTALYFCRNRGSVSTCERLEVDEFGNIANWPENFFGNEMGDLLAMAQAQMERQKRMEA